MTSIYPGCGESNPFSLIPTFSIGMQQRKQKENMEEFKRPSIPQHKEVLHDGVFVPKVIKKDKKTILEREQLKEFEEEVKELYDK